MESGMQLARFREMRFPCLQTFHQSGNRIFMTQGKILAFAGSSRRESINQRLLLYITNRLRGLGAEVTVVDFREFEIPLFGEDFLTDNGFPADAQRFYGLLKAHPAFLIACPEYNRSITPLLKNVIDWSTIPRPDDRPMAAFEGKVAGLCAASNGKLGGLRGLFHVSDILQSIGTNVLPKQVAVGNFNSAFDDNDGLVDKMAASMCESMCEQLMNTVRGAGPVPAR
jgi:NAD(P)H-dependent FMN reductase